MTEQEREQQKPLFYEISLNEEFFPFVDKRYFRRLTKEGEIASENYPMPMYLSEFFLWLPIEGEESYFFTDYFPLDSGPLAANNWGTSYYEDPEELIVGEGHELYFSDKEEEIQQIGVKFIVDPVLLQKFED